TSAWARPIASPCSRSTGRPATLPRCSATSPSIRASSSPSIPTVCRPAPGSPSPCRRSEVAVGARGRPRSHCSVPLAHLRLERPSPPAPRRRWLARVVLLLLAGFLAVSAAWGWSASHLSASRREAEAHRPKAAQRHLELARLTWPLGADAHLLAARVAR